MRRYKVVQAGPKTKFGGVKKGLFKKTYHVEMEGKVKIEPTIPAASQTNIEKTKRLKLITLKAYKFI